MIQFHENHPDAALASITRIEALGFAGISPEEETAVLELVRMFHPDLHEQDPEKRKTYELLTQAINEARDRGDIGLLELIAKDPQAFILKQGLGHRFTGRGARANGTSVAL